MEAEISHIREEMDGLRMRLEAVEEWIRRNEKLAESVYRLLKSSYWEEQDTLDAIFRKGIK